MIDELKINVRNSMKQLEIIYIYTYTVVHKKRASTHFAITSQILTDFDNFCTKLTSNELRTSGYQNVSLHRACVSTLPC